MADFLLKLNSKLKDSPLCFACCKKKRRTSEGSRNERPLIYRNDNIDDIYEGVSYVFTGSLKPDKKLFINLNTNDITQDIALLLHPSRCYDCLVATTRVTGSWIEEQEYSPLPSSFKVGSNFCIQVLVTETCYMIAVNGCHLGQYNHKMNYRWARCIEVNGEAQHLMVVRTVVGSYPNRLGETQAKNVPHASDFVANSKLKYDMNLSYALINEQEEFPIPYMRGLPPKSFTVGRCLKIDGRVLKKPHSFSISIQRGQDVWPHPVVAFRLKTIFESNKVSCSGSYYKKEWSIDKPADLGAYTDLMPGADFTMFFVVREKAYEVYLNRLRIITFIHHMDVELVDTLYIEGDIALLNVMLLTGYFSQ